MKATACWLCEVKFVKGLSLEKQGENQHLGVDRAQNWDPHRYEDYFRRVEDFLRSAAAFQGVTHLGDVYQELAEFDYFRLFNSHSLSGCFFVFPHPPQSNSNFLLRSVTPWLHSYYIGGWFSRYWIGLHLFNDDTCPPGHISRPSQVRFTHNWLSSINRLQNLMVLLGLNRVQNLVAWWLIWIRGCFGYMAIHIR